jgi:hypothetical protein
MKSSEKTLVIATVAVVALGLYIKLSSGGSGLFSASSGSEGNLAAEQERFRQYAGFVRDGDQIREAYNRVTLRNIPERRGNKRPGDTFVDELARILTDEFHQVSPRVDPYVPSKIPKVEDYYFVDVDVAMDGQVGEMIRLLLQMEQRGLLIKEFTLDRRTDFRASLKVKVARLVQHDAFSRRMMRNLRD